MNKTKERDAAIKAAAKSLLSSVGAPTAQVLKTFPQATLANCTVQPSDVDDQTLWGPKIIVKGTEKPGIILLVVVSELCVETISVPTSETPTSVGKKIKDKSAFDEYTLHIKSSAYRHQQLAA